MEKYANSSSSMSRTKRNEQIYNSTNMGELSRISTNTNVSVISDAPKEIDLEKIKKYVYSINDDEPKQERVTLELPPEEETVVVRKEEKNYDINAVLESARGERETDYEENRHRKINNTQIDILKSIKVKEKKQAEKDDDITGPIDELNTEEKTIVDLIQNIQSHGKKKELFEDLMGSDNDTVVMAPIEEEINKERLKEELLNITQDLESIKLPENDFTQEINLEKEKLKNNKEPEKDEEETDPKENSFYTNSVSFDKSDFEEFEELEKEAKGSGFFTKMAIVLIILILLGTIFLICNYVFKLGII